MAASRNRADPHAQASAPTEMVAACLAAHLAPAQDLHLALSGGRDSVVLLHILHGLLPGRLRAIHVHHGLSPHADEWARFCADACRALDVPLEIRAVRVEKRGRGLEAAARAARYRAFLDSGASILALAHHRRDQAETLLLNLCRGAGVSGAAGMPPRHVLQQDGRRLILLRPLLHADARDILAYAQAHRLAWVEDESNADIRYRRNFLRARIFPELATRFPAIDATLSRAAGHFAETEELLAELAALDEAHTGGRIQALRGLSPARQANWLRQRLKKLGWHLPDANALAEILRQLAQVRDADNHFRHLLPEGSLYLWQDRLHCVPDVPLSRLPIAWDARTPLAWSGGFLSLRASRETGLRAAPLAGKILQIRPRQGGEALRPAPNRPRRPLKHLLREARIPPWQRERLPLIYLDDEFLACPGVAIAADWQCRRGEMGLLPVFQQGG